MRTKIVGFILVILAVGAWGFYPLSAQVNPQANPQGTTQSSDGNSQLVQPGSPYSRVPPYGATPQSPQQGYNRQGASGPAPGIQAPPSDLSQVNRRPCGWVAITQPPPLPPLTTVPNQPQTVPVQGLWVGSSAGGAQTVSQQPQQLSSRGPLSAQGPGINPVPILYQEPVSAIETAFQQLPLLTGGTRDDLRQYGYSLFSSPVSTFAPVEDVPVGPDYILGPGDDLAINVWGAMDSGIVRTVDRNGQIILPSVGPVRVWGLTFSQAERLIREQLARYYRGFQTNVTMGRLRTIKVYVVGEVCQPGSFTLSSLSTVTNALFSAGGPLKLGSLRKIQIKRNDHTVGTLDLYDFLLRGDKTRDFRLESGDTIFVPPIGPIVAITGEVKRPAIYEINGPTHVTDLIEMAGGLMPQSYLKRVQLIRTKPNAEREVIDLDLTHPDGDGVAPQDIQLRNGDLVRIYPADPRIYNAVSLGGAVKHPGEYELKPGMRISELLGKGALLPEAYPDRIEIARIKDNLATEILSVDIKKAWEGDKSQDVALQRSDSIFVRSEFKAPGTVRLEGEVMRPGLYRFQPGERLSSVLKRAGGFTDKSFLKGAIFTRVTVQETEKKRLDDFIKEQEQHLVSETAQLTPTALGVNSDRAMAQQAVFTQRKEQLQLLASRVTLGRVVIQLSGLDKFEGSPSDLVLQDGDSLTVPERPGTVLVMGSVRNPTGIIYKDDTDVQYYLNRAGGVTPDADAKGIYLLKADGSAITGFMKLRDIEPGDVVIVPPSTETKADWGPMLRDLATIAGQAALGLAGLVAIAK